MKPIVKLQAVGAGGVGAGVVVYLAGLFGLELPPEVAAAIVLLAGWGAGYLKRDPLIETTKQKQQTGDPATE